VPSLPDDGSVWTHGSGPGCRLPPQRTRPSIRILLERAGLPTSDLTSSSPPEFIAAHVTASS